jgi:DHA1 family bicyclomycin/chloramphenicol resistance-like MFS transporter
MTTTVSATRDVSRPEFIALIAGLMALNALAIDVMLPALPYMGEALGVMNENDRHFVLTAYMLGFGLAQLAFGPLSDRFGRRAPLLVGMVVYILAAFAAVFSPNLATLLVVFMVIPVIAPAIGQVILFTGPWEYIFVFMAGLGAVIAVWTYIRLPETLALENRRTLRPAVVIDGFRTVLSNRMAIMYGLAGTFIFGALFGFINTSQQIYVDVYGLGALFPLAFAFQASLMSVSSYTNSRMVRRVGMRRLSHGALLVFTAMSGVWLVLAMTVPMPLWLFMTLLCVIMFMFGWTTSNMNSLSMEPLGAVAGTASSVFGFIQTVGGAILGTVTGSFFDGSITPIAAGYFIMGLLAIGCVLIAENGKLFGVGEEYKDAPPTADVH